MTQVSSSRFDSVQSVRGGLNAPLSEQSSKLINSTLNSHMEIFLSIYLIDVPTGTRF